MKQDEVRLEFAAIDFERNFLAVIHDDLCFDDIFGRDRIEPQCRSFESFDIAFRHGNRCEASVGGRIKHQLDVGDFRRIDGFGGVGRRCKRTCDRSIAQSFFQARDLGAEFSCAEIFHRHFFHADRLAALVGGRPSHQIQSRR